MTVDHGRHHRGHRHGPLVIVGALFFTAGTIGLIRFPDVRSRLHALAEAALGSRILGGILVWLAVTAPRAANHADVPVQSPRSAALVAIGLAAGALTSLAVIAAPCRLPDGNALQVALLMMNLMPGTMVQRVIGDGDTVELHTLSTELDPVKQWEALQDRIERALGR